jgi:hypothetical protein
MTLKFVDGFDWCDQAEKYIDRKYSGGYQIAGENWVILSGEGRNGGGCLRAEASNSFLAKFVENTTDTLIVGFALKTDDVDWDPGDDYMLGIDCGRGGHGYPNVILDFTSTGKPVIRRKTSAIGYATIASGEQELSLDTWYYMEIKARIHDSDGAMEFRVSGEDMNYAISGEGVDTKYHTWLGNPTSVYIRGKNANNDYWYIDDLYICTPEGTVNNDFLGPCRVHTMVPNSSGEYQDFTPSGEATNYQAVGIQHISGEETRVRGHNSLATDTYNYPASGVSGEVFGVQLSHLAKRNQPFGTIKLRPVVYSGELVSGELLPVGDRAFYQTAVFDRNPITDENWSGEIIDTTEFGFRVQMSGEIAQPSGEHIYTCFGEYSLGVEPSDWTEFWDTTKFSMNIVSGELSGKKFMCDVSNDLNMFAMGWNDVSGESDLEILALVDWDGAFDWDQIGPACCISGGASDLKGYVLQPDAKDSQLYIRKVAPTEGIGIALDSYGMAFSGGNTKYWLRFRKWGGRLWGKAWAHSGSEPTDWQVSAIDTDPHPPGAVGLANYTNDAYCDFYSVALKGGTAFMSGELCT